MTRARASLVVAALAAVAAACSSSEPSASPGASDASSAAAAIPDANDACATSADCPRGLACAYAVTAGCAAHGECVYPDCVEDPECPPAPRFFACGCDGAPVAYVTADYAHAPVASPGPCGDAAVADADDVADAAVADAAVADAPAQ